VALIGFGRGSGKGLRLAARDRESHGGRELGEVWERRWQRRRGSEFHWFLSEPPQQLKEVLEAGGLLQGAAYDLGCGPGQVTRLLARSFWPAVGFDIAYSAVREARDATDPGQTPAGFVVAAAPDLPFQTNSAAFVFDRGCLQAVDRRSWPRYFQEVDRVLKPGGAFQLFVSQRRRPWKERLSPAGLRIGLRRIVRRKRGAGFSDSDILRLAPAGWQRLALDHFPLRHQHGKVRIYTYMLFRKSSLGPRPA
jgi:SAM-dependent methyltransferase